MLKAFFAVLFMCFSLPAAASSKPDLMSCENFNILYGRVINKDGDKGAYGKKSTSLEPTSEEIKNMSLINATISGYISAVQDLTRFNILDPSTGVSFEKILKSVYGRCSVDKENNVLRVLVVSPYVKRAFSSFKNKVQEGCNKKINGVKALYQQECDEKIQRRKNFGATQNFYR